MQPIRSKSTRASSSADVEALTPDDPEIKERLAEAIQTNVELYTQRVRAQEELKSQRRLIEGQAHNEEAREQLVERELRNLERETLEAARIEAEADLIRARGRARAAFIEARAHREAEVRRVRELAAALDTPGGRTYVELERARVLRETDKVIVPGDGRLWLGLGSSGLVEGGDFPAGGIPEKARRFGRGAP